MVTIRTKGGEEKMRIERPGGGVSNEQGEICYRPESKMKR